MVLNLVCAAKEDYLAVIPELINGAANLVKNAEQRMENANLETNVKTKQQRAKQRRENNAVAITTNVNAARLEISVAK